MEDLIILKNDSITNYVMFKLDKLDNGFTEYELNQINEIVIDYNDEEDYNYTFFEDLLKLKKIETLTLRNGFIYNNNYSIFFKLKNLKGIIFENCEFENSDLIASLDLKSLSLINCKINSYLFINIFRNLEELTIINGKLSLKKINMLEKLKYLQISYSDIIDLDELNINKLEELYIDNTNINNFKFLSELTNLKRISIDEKQYKNNQELFNNMSSNGILVLNENMVKFGGEIDEI